MAQRLFKSRFTVASDEVQGEGSHVVFQRATWGIIQSVNTDGDSAGVALLRAVIVDWDWVDDDGNPLPLPSADPQILDRIPQVELDWLLDNSGIMRAESDAKN